MLLRSWFFLCVDSIPHSWVFRPKYISHIISSRSTFLKFGASRSKLSRIHPLSFVARNVVYECAHSTKRILVCWHVFYVVSLMIRARDGRSCAMNRRFILHYNCSNFSCVMTLKLYLPECVSCIGVLCVTYLDLLRLGSWLLDFLLLTESTEFGSRSICVILVRDVYVRIERLCDDPSKNAFTVQLFWYFSYLRVFLKEDGYYSMLNFFQTDYPEKRDCPFCSTTHCVRITME